MMRSSLASQIAHNQLLAALSIEAAQTLPTTTKCPICKTEGSLEVARGASSDITYRCRNRQCHFQGDAIELFAMVETGRDISEACNQLLALNVLRPSSNFRTLVDEYVAHSSARYNDVVKFWLQARAMFQAADSYVCGILARMNCWDTPQTTLSPEWLGCMLGACTGSDLIDNFFSGYKWSSSWVKKKMTYLVMPMWEDFLTITGFTVWNENMEPHHVSCRHGTPGVGVGLLQNYHLHDDVLVATDNPIHAVQLTHAGITHGMRFPAVYVHKDTTSWAQLVVRRNVLVNHSHSLGHYRLALRQPDCQVVQPEQVALMRSQSARAKLDELYDLAKRSHVALADYFCRLNTSDAIAAAQELNLSSTDAARVLSALPEHKREEVKNILEARMENQSIVLGNEVITCAKEGWVSEKKGLICDAMFFVDQIIWDAKTKEGQAVGLIMQGDRQVPFSSPLKEVQTRTLDWLTNTLLEAGATIPFATPGWGSKLWLIARKFREPETVQNSSHLGWDNDLAALTLPLIRISGGKVERNPRTNTDGLPGSNLTVPAPLKPDEAIELAYDDIVGGCFWALFASILVNVFSPFHKKGTFGIAVISEGDTVMREMLHRCVDEIGVPSVSFSTSSKRRLDEIKAQEVSSPLPIYIGQAWEESDGFGKWLRMSQERNCLAEMNRAVATGTSVEGGWMYLSENTGTKDVHAIDRLDGLWRALPLFIAWTQEAGVQIPTEKSDIVDKMLYLVQQWLEDFDVAAAKVLNRARPLVKLDMVDRTSSYGAKLLNFVIECVEAGGATFADSTKTEDYTTQVIADRKGEVVFFSRKLLTSLMGEVGLVAPANSVVVEALRGSNCLVGTSYAGVKGYAVSQDQYNLYWALRRSAVA